MEDPSAAQSPRTFTPMSSYPGVKEIAAADHSIEGSLARLHEIAWGKRDINVLFHDHVVNRDGTCTQPDIPNPNPPHTVRVLRWGKANLGVLGTYGIASLFIRSEYRGTLQDLLRIAGVAAGDGEFPVPDFPHGSSLFSAIVCGSSGIGKTAFLIFVLALRILFGLPTVFQLYFGQFLVVNAAGVFWAKLGEIANLGDYIPDYTWLLVDSNQNVVAMPEEYIRLVHGTGCFILQAASPRTGRLEWMKKVTGRVSIFWMAPWSPAELIAARSLQTWRNTEPSEAQLLAFAQKYGTSARHVYGYAATPDEYEEDLVSRSVSALDSETIRTMLKKAEGAEMDNEISHLLLEIHPAPHDRRKFFLDIPTDYLVDKIVERLEVADQMAALHLYWLFLTNSHTRSAAGHLLEKAFKTQFPRGGEWPIMKMKRRGHNSIIRWRVHDSATEQYLRVGYKRETSSISGRPVKNIQDAITPLEDAPYARGASFTLTSGRFYRPVPKNFPSYDGFVYDAREKRATVFQVTIAKDHEIVHEGLNWLCGLGASSIDLVVVTCPSNVDPEFFGTETIWTNDDGIQRINDVYHLPLRAG